MTQITPDESVLWIKNAALILSGRKILRCAEAPVVHVRRAVLSEIG